MNAETCLVPGYDRIIDDPELASLAVLDAALVASRNSLQAHLPELGDPSSWREGGLPEPETLLGIVLLVAGVLWALRVRPEPAVVHGA